MRIGRGEIDVDIEAISLRAMSTTTFHDILNLLNFKGF